MTVSEKQKAILDLLVNSAFDRHLSAPRTGTFESLESEVSKVLEALTTPELPRDHDYAILNAAIFKQEETLAGVNPPALDERGAEVRLDPFGKIVERNEKGEAIIKDQAGEVVLDPEHKERLLKECKPLLENDITHGEAREYILAQVGQHLKQMSEQLRKAPKTHEQTPGSLNFLEQAGWHLEELLAQYKAREDDTKVLITTGNSEWQWADDINFGTDLAAIRRGKESIVAAENKAIDELLATPNGQKLLTLLTKEQAYQLYPASIELLVSEKGIVLLENKQLNIDTILEFGLNSTQLTFIIEHNSPIEQALNLSERHHLEGRNIGLDIAQMSRDDEFDKTMPLDIRRFKLKEQHKDSSYQDVYNILTGLNRSKRRAIIDYGLEREDIEDVENFGPHSLRAMDALMQGEEGLDVNQAFIVVLGETEESLRAQVTLSRQSSDSDMIPFDPSSSDGDVDNRAPGEFTEEELEMMRRAEEEFARQNQARLLAAANRNRQPEQQQPAAPGQGVVQSHIAYFENIIQQRQQHREQQQPPAPLDDISAEGLRERERAHTP